MDPEKIKKIVVKGFSFKEILAKYEKHAKEGLWASEKKLVKKYFREKNVLDLGCGTGRTSFGMQKLGYDVTGLDLTPAMLNVAKKLNSKKNVKFSVGDASSLKYKNESFDNVLFSFNGWDQIPGKENRQKAISEAYRVLKKGGFFIFTSHVREIKYVKFFIKQSWMSILRFFRYRMREVEFGDIFFKEAGYENFKGGQFVHIPSKGMIKKQITKAGFKLVFCDKRNNISSRDSNLDSGDCTFFVCKK